MATDDDFAVPPPETPESRAAARKKTKEEAAAKKAAPAGRSHGARSKATILADVETSLVETLAKGGAVAFPFVPLPAAYVIHNGAEGAAIVTRLASHNPKMLKALTKASSGMDWVALGLWLFGLLIAVGVQFGRIPPDSIMVNTFNIDVLMAEIDEEFAKVAAAQQQQQEEAADGDDEQTGDGFLPTPPILGGRLVAS